MTVRDELDDLKFRLRLKTDQQLAVALNTTKVSIDKWISKKAIPQKWRRIIELQYPKSHNRLKIPIFYKEREMTHSCEACREHSGASESPSLSLIWRRLSAIWRGLIIKSIWLARF